MVPIVRQATDRNGRAANGLSRARSPPIDQHQLSRAALIKLARGLAQQILNLLADDQSIGDRQVGQPQKRLPQGGSVAVAQQASPSAVADTPNVGDGWPRSANPA